jgi:hypothetical protein
VELHIDCLSAYTRAGSSPRSRQMFLEFQVNDDQGRPVELGTGLRKTGTPENELRSSRRDYRLRSPSVCQMTQECLTRATVRGIGCDTADSREDDLVIAGVSEMLDNGSCRSWHLGNFVLTGEPRPLPEVTTVSKLDACLGESDNVLRSVAINGNSDTCSGSLADSRDDVTDIEKACSRRRGERHSERTRGQIVDVLHESERAHEDVPSSNVVITERT